MPDSIVHRYITAQVSPTPTLRTAMYEGREHLVIPVIPLIGDSVIRPLHSDGPEFVPAYELSIAPAQWSGRPIVPDHPHQGLASANDPATLDSQRFGYIFNSRYEDGKLKLDAYLDPTRADLVGEAAQAVIADLRANKMVEVSVGAWVTLERVDGTSPSGVPYQYRWRGLISDHLAIGLNGSRGACSIDMGCGALRTASKEPAMTLSQRLMDNVRSVLGLRPAASGTSDIQLRDSLNKALHSVEPGFDWVVEAYPPARAGSSGTVIYAAMPDDKMLYLRRTFTMADGDVTLNDDRVEVKSETSWKPVAAEGATTEAHECQCHKAAVVAATEPTTTTESEAVTPASDTQQPDSKGDPAMPDVSDTVKALVGRLVACEASPFADADRPKLETWPEATLVDLDTKYSALANPKPPTQPESQVQAQTEEQWLATAPPQVRAMYTRYQAAEASHRASLVEAITKLQGAGAFTPQQLNAKPIEELELLAKALRANTAIDYSGRSPLPVVVAAGESTYPAPPDIYNTPKPNANSTVTDTSAAVQ